MRLPDPGQRYEPRNEAETRAALERADELNRKKGRDVDLSQGERLILKSPDGTRWSITVSNAGALSATSL
jgi:hypothetical protein